MTKIIEASLTISRDSSDTIRIKVQDKLSRTRFVELKVSPHDFAMAVTGLAEVEVTAEVNHLDRVGLKRVSEARKVVCPLETSDKEKLKVWLEKNAQEPGWILNTYLGSQTSIRRNGDETTLNYSVFKFVDPDSEEGGET